MVLLEFIKVLLMTYKILNEVPIHTYLLVCYVLKRRLAAGPFSTCSPLLE